VNDGPKSATAARIYDYLLGGTHNFPADRDAAHALVQAAPLVPAIARANRAFLRRAVRFLADSGVRQFLDVGSGIVFQARTATPLGTRSRDDIEQFFGDFEFVEPGLVRTPLWRPAPDDPTDFADNPHGCNVVAGVARKP
jgi:hypothetical protein